MTTALLWYVVVACSFSAGIACGAWWQARGET
jgi:hypothetical protein